MSDGRERVGEGLRCSMRKSEGEMVGWHHRLNGNEFEQTLGDGEGQGSLVCCSLWGREESDTYEQLNNNKLKHCDTSPGG